MIQLRCTKKVLDQFRLKASDLIKPSPSNTALGNWYANLVTIERRKTLVFMNERTLLSFIVFGVKKSNSNKLADIFDFGVMQLLRGEGFSDRQIDAALGAPEDVQLTRTDSRKALGNLNDLAYIYEHSILYDGGFAHCDLWKIMQSTNRMPQRNIGWGYSIDLARELLAAHA